MATCYKCNGWCEDGNSICPDCKRAQEMMIRQEELSRRQSLEAQQHEQDMRRIAQEQVDEQERIANESHLNGLKRKLLEVAMEGVSSPKKAAKEALVIMRSPDFTDNVAWFWPTVSKNEFLKETYLADLLSRVDEKTDPEEFFGVMDGSVYPDAYDWAERHTDSPQGAVLFSKIDEFNDILNKRQNQQEADEKKQAEEASIQQAKNAQKEAAVRMAKSSLSLVASIIFILSALPIAVHVTTLWYNAWSSAGGNPKEWSVMLASAGHSSLAGGVSVWLGLLVYVGGLLVAVKFVKNALYDRDDDDQALYSFIALLGAVWTVWHYWGAVSDSRIHVGMVVACIASPFIPYLRGALAAFAAGMILAYAMVVPGWVAGWTVGSLTGWATTKHPTQVSQAYQPSASTGKNTSAVLKKTDAQRR